ncbi:MAG: glycosyltransferase, partial [Dokdonella sp.]
PLALAPPVAGEWLLPFACDAMKAEVAIIIPVFNAPAAVAVCLDSVVKHTPNDVRVIVIDDASDDPTIAPLLQRHADHPNWSVLRNPANCGFSATVNRGMRAAGAADVVLLNADTEIAAHWLTGLRRAAVSREDIGTVTAVSDNAGAFSVPELERENPFPAAWSFAGAARALWQQSGLAYPALPTGNGFCMYIKRRVLASVGDFDAEAFPQGYGEENDFCQRAEAAGFVHVIAGNVLVRHARSQSFGVDRRAALGRAGMTVLRERWPHYETAIAASLFSFERRVLDWRVRRAFAMAEPPRPRVLRIANAPNDMDGAVNSEIWEMLRDGEDTILGRHVDDTDVQIIERVPGWLPRVPARALRPRQMLWEWLQRYAFEAIEISVDSEHAAEVERLAGLLGISCARAPNGARMANQWLESTT